jgi:Niemann-Pick C1 protein
MAILAGLFYRLGKFSSRRPILVILIALSFTIFCSVGLIWLNVQTDPQKLWVDPSSRTNHEQDYFDDQFGKFYRVNQAVFTSRLNRETTDVFQKQYLQELWFLQAQMESTLNEYNNILYNVNNYCYKPIKGKGCFISSPMDYWKMNLTDMLNDPDIKVTAQCVNQQVGEQILCSDRNNIPIIRNVTFGGVSCLDNTGDSCQSCKIDAKALIITFLLENQQENIDQGVEDWEKNVFEKLIDDYNNDDTKLLHIVYYSERSISDELAKEDDQNILYVILSYVFMFTYISVAIGTFPSRLHTRFMVGGAGIFIVISSVVIAIGATSAFGIQLSMISIEVVPFLILAIGVDNMFIISIGEKQIIALAEKKKESITHEEVLGLALKEIGPSITAAAFSEFAAFIVGSTTGIPALTNFCITASIAVLADFFLQITAFVAVIELDHRRRQQRRLDCFPCFDLEEAPKDPKRAIIRWFVTNYYEPVLFHPITKISVLIAFVAIFTLSFASYDKLDLGLTEQVSVVKDGNLYNYFNTYNEFLEVGSIAYVVFKNIDYTNAENLILLDQISDELSQMTDTVQPPVYSWVKTLNSFLNDQEEECNNLDISQYDFNTQLRLFLAISIDSTCCKKYGICGEQFDTDIIFDDSGNIVTSRFRFQHKALVTQQDYIDALRDTRYVIDQISQKFVPLMNSQANLKSSSLGSSIDWTDSSTSLQNADNLAFIYSLFYVYYDQYSDIRGIAVQNLLLACGAVLLAIELLANLYAAAIVTLMVGCTTWGLIGFCYVWNLTDPGYGVEINAISVVNLVMCCGLAVEFCVHIMTSYIKQSGTNEERARKALVDMGSTVMTGIVSTKLIGVTVLGLAPSEVFTIYYFRMYMGIIVLGFFHGLALQPILLSYFGPKSEGQAIRSKKHEKMLDTILRTK